MRLGNKGSLFCLVAGRVTDTIDKTGQVSHIVVNKTVQLQLRGKQLAHGITDLHTGIKQITALFRLHPDPQVALGGRHMAFQGKRREAEAGVQLLPQGRPERHQHRRLLAFQRIELAQCRFHRLQVLAAAEAELEEQMMLITTIKNPRLRCRHR
ncbi:MAG: hypothetical protein R3348_09950 [Xanthomonadales bacterium]|nr:hypothetical protein [Xanthomonadales bacterium]